ncbi:PKD domain-containing protein [Thermovibrio ammonificans]
MSGYRSLIAVLSLALLTSSASGATTKLKWKLGYKPTPASFAEKHMLKPPKVKASQLPTSVDLCQYLPPVGNQGYQGSCVAWAVGYYYKTFQEGREHGWDVSNETHICSPAFIYNQINNGEDQGSIIADALTLLTREGCDNLADMPYNDQDYTTLPTKEQMLNALPWRADSFGFFYEYDNDCDYNNCKRDVPLTDTQIEELKAHLASGDVFVMAIPVFDGFVSLNSTNYFYNGPTANETYLGGHAIIICGYDDSIGNGTGGFKIRNSWGTGWGNNGEAYISYDFVKNYSFEAAAMVDRIGYNWNVVADIDIDNLYRADAGIAFNGTNNQTFIFMGDYIWQEYASYWPNGGDQRRGIHAVVDLTDLGLPPYYTAILGDLNYSVNGYGNTGTLTSLVIRDASGNSVSYSGVPLDIPDGDVISFRVPGLGVGINYFKASPTSGYYPLDVAFDYSVTGENVTCSFDFNGDGKPDQVIQNCSNGTVSYTYTAAGNYTATLTVTDGSVTASRSVTVSALNAPPYVDSFTASPTSGYYPLNVSFSYSVGDINGDNLLCSFDFNGDGKPEQVIQNCSNGTVSYTYTAAGNYTATLTVTDGNATANATTDVQVYNGAPTIGSFSASPTSVDAPLTVRFDFNVSDPDHDSLTCKFDFDGDGSVDRVIYNCVSGSTSYTYQDAGNYTATLVVTDGVNEAKSSVGVTVSSSESGVTTNSTSCSLSPAVPASTGAVNFLFMLAPLFGLAGLRRGRKE